jgi:hypothetical protein
VVGTLPDAMPQHVVQVHGHHALRRGTIAVFECGQAGRDFLQRRRETQSARTDPGLFITPLARLHAGGILSLLAA